jgi:glycerol uptake facilitator-like aquaporin
MLAILFLAAEKHKATFIAPVGIGIALFMAEMWGVYYTGGSLNPARSFGPSVADHKFNGYGESEAVLILSLFRYASEQSRLVKIER